MVEREDAGSLFSTEASVSSPDQELSQRIMAQLQRTATAVPPGTSSVRGIRSADLVHLVEEAMGPERLALRAEAERYRERIAALEQELLSVRGAADETRRFELPRLAALVDVERSRAGELERELSEVERKVSELEQALRRSEEARQRQVEELHELEEEEEESEEAHTQTEELLLALDQRLAALEEGVFTPEAGGEDQVTPPAPAAPAEAAAGAAREEEERTRLLLEQFARSEERAARIEALEQALEELGGDELPASGRAPRRTEPARQALLAEALERQARGEARTAELVRTLQVTQELLSREVRRRTAIERELRALAVRVAAVESAPALTWSSAELAGLQLPEGEGLARVVALLRGEGARRERELQGQVERLSLATRSALERMAEILDQALALGARPRASQALDEVGLLRPSPPGWSAWVGEGLDFEEALDPETSEPPAGASEEPPADPEVVEVVGPPASPEAADEEPAGSTAPGGAPERHEAGVGRVDEEEEDGAAIRGGAGPAPVDPRPVDRPADPRADASPTSDWLAELSHASARRGSTPPAMPRARFQAPAREEEPEGEVDPGQLARSPDPATRRLARSLLGALRDQAALKAERDRALTDRGRLEDKARHAELALESEVWRGFATHRELVQARQRLRELEEQLDGQLERVEAEQAPAPPAASPRPATARSGATGRPSETGHRGAAASPRDPQAAASSRHSQAASPRRDSDELPLAVPSRAAPPPSPLEDALLLRQAERVADLQREVEDRDSILHWLMLEADPHYHHDKGRAIRACEQALESLAASPDAAERSSEREQLTDLLHWLRVEQRREGAGEPPFSA